MNSTLNKILGLAPLFIFLLLFATFSVNSIKAYEYEVHGKMSYRYFNRKSGETIIDQEQDFTIAVDGCKFFLKKIPTEFIRHGKPKEMEDYIVASSDLTNFYYLASLETIVKNHAKPYLDAKQSSNAVMNSASGIIGNGSVPYGTDPTIGLLWYAFASGCYFKTAVEDDFIYGITPFPNVGFYSQDFRVKSRWALDTSPPNLPKQIIFTYDYKFLNGRQDATITEAPAETNCIYKTIEFTNVGDLSIPSKGIAEFPTTNDIYTIFEFTVSEVLRHSTVKDFVPKLPGSTLLSDYRPIASTKSTAVPTGPVLDWPKLSVTKVAYQKMLRTYKEPANPQARGWVVGLCLVMVGFLPVFWILWRRIASQSPNVKTTQNNNKK